MLDSLYIKGFKLFEELNVPELSRLNLFVGSNNTGKSCLLEAVRLFATDASSAVIRDLVRARDGDLEANLVNSAGVPENFPSYAPSPIWSLFNAPRELTIEVGSCNKDRHIRLSVDWYRKGEGLGSWVPLDAIESLLLVGDAEHMLEVSIGGARSHLIKLDSIFQKPGLFGSIRPPVDDRIMIPVAVVGTEGLSRREVSSLWDRINLTDWHDKVLDCLRLIEPRVEGIAFVGDSERKAVLRLNGITERVPLKSMGDGLTRLFHIALAMVNAEGGYLLIDEFENGLYWDVQEQLWPVVFEMAELLNVQVFATTHSNDCVKGFERAWESRPDLGAMYRLERTGSSVTAFRLPMEGLSDALDSLVEVR